MENPWAGNEEDRLAGDGPACIVLKNHFPFPFSLFVSGEECKDVLSGSSQNCFSSLWVFSDI